MSPSKNTYPKLHNAAWPGLVGKGEGSEPPIELDKMIELTANASVDGVKFDGMDLFLSDPHISIDLDADGVKKLADTFRSKSLAIGSLVAPAMKNAGSFWNRCAKPAASASNSANSARAPTA